MKPLLTTFTALLLCAALAAPAFAGDGAGRRGKGKKKGHRIAKLFQRFDKDGSGSLTSDEVPERVWTRISKADADGDGAVTKAELKAACKKRKQRGKKKGDD